MVHAILLTSLLRISQCPLESIFSSMKRSRFCISTSASIPTVPQVYLNTETSLSDLFSAISSIDICAIHSLRLSLKQLSAVEYLNRGDGLFPSGIIQDDAALVYTLACSATVAVSSNLLGISMVDMQFASAGEAMTRDRVSYLSHSLGVLLSIRTSMLQVGRSRRKL